MGVDLLERPLMPEEFSQDPVPINRGPGGIGFPPPDFGEPGYGDFGKPERPETSRVARVLGVLMRHPFRLTSTNEVSIGMSTYDKDGRSKSKGDRPWELPENPNWIGFSGLE